MATPVEGGEVQGTEPGNGAGEESPGLNPAWGEALSAIPEQFHQVLTPHFQQWDQAAQQRIESVNQQLSQFDPYKPFVENQIAPEDLEQGLQLMYQLNANPQAVYNALAEAYGFNAQASEGQPEEAESEEQTFQDPRVDQIQQGLDLVAQTILQQQQQKLEAEAEAQIDAELGELKQKFPGISEEFALSLMINGFDVNQVGEHWQGVTQNILQSNPRPFAPSVMGTSTGGTGLPSQAIDPRQLNSKDTRALVARMVQAQMADGN